MAHHTQPVAARSPLTPRISVPVPDRRLKGVVPLSSHAIALQPWTGDRSRGSGAHEKARETGHTSR